jgi:hypothetical protein
VRDAGRASPDRRSAPEAAGDRIPTTTPPEASHAITTMLATPSAGGPNQHNLREGDVPLLIHATIRAVRGVRRHRGRLARGGETDPSA